MLGDVVTVYCKVIETHKLKLLGKKLLFVISRQSFESVSIVLGKQSVHKVT